MDYENIENSYYLSKYGKPIRGNSKELWNEIINNQDLLRWAITKVRDKFDERDIVNGLAICDSILTDYKNVPKDIYMELINLIYSNKNIARLVVDGASNGGYSYLLMALWNYEMVLDSKMKSFAIDEAMNKIGTVRYRDRANRFSLELENNGISDEDNSIINIDGCVNPIGNKSKCEYINYMFNTLSDTQAHGCGEFDIRYYILRNPNFNNCEKKKLIYDFWDDDLEYSDCLDAWKWNVLNEIYRHDSLGEFDRDYMYSYKYDDYLYLIQDKNITDMIWEEIRFCSLMEELRPIVYEEDLSCNKKLSLRK